VNEPRREILDNALAALHRGAGLSAIVTEEQHSADRVFDAVVKIQTEHGDKYFVAEVKTVDRFKTPAQVKTQLERRAELPLLIAPFISKETAEHCRELHLSFIDTAGNAFLEAPGLYVYVTGQPRPKVVGESRFRAIGAAGLQVTFALLSRPALVQAPYREIARAAATALGSITHVMRDLESRGFLTGDKHRRLLDPHRLIEEWVTHYPITLRPKLRPRRFEASPELIAQADLTPYRAYWSGERAAERLTKFLKPVAFTIYAPKSISRVVAALRLRAHPTGNAEVLETFWNFEPDPGFPDLVPPVLAYADLMNSRDGRNIEAAKQIYEQYIEADLRTPKIAR
jgi:hypothetical protein